MLYQLSYSRMSLLTTYGLSHYAKPDHGRESECVSKCVGKGRSRYLTDRSPVSENKLTSLRIWPLIDDQCLNARPPTHVRYRVER